MDAEVRLSAVDDVSGPVARAVSSLAQYDAAIDSMSALGGQTAESAARTAAGITATGTAAEHSVGAHRAAHQAINLVSGSLVEMAGGSAAAEAGVRVLDSVMFQMAVTGGAVSLGVVALIAGAAALGYAFKSSAEDAKKEAEALDRMTESATKAVAQLNYLDAVQKSVAGVGAGNLSEKIIKLKNDIGDLTEKMRQNAEAASRGEQVGFGATMMTGLKAGFTGQEAGDANREATAAAQVKMAGQLRVLQEELKKTQHEQSELTLKSSAYKSVLADQGDPLKIYAAHMDMVASSTQAVGQALGDTDATMEQVARMANNLGVDYVRAASIMRAQTEAVKSGVVNLAGAFGTMLGNAIMGAKDAWKEGLKSMISAVFDAATQVVIAAAIMNEAISAALIPGTFVGILAMVAVLQAMKAVAVSALSGAQSGLNAKGASYSNIAGGGGSSDPNGGTGAGGTAVSSAQKEVVNNVQVNLPIQALDLSSISDIQLKNLATRVGRVLADAAGTGQFSLVGA